MNLSIYLPTELVKQIKFEAEKDHRSVSQFIKLAMITSLSNNTKQNQLNIKKG